MALKRGTKAYWQTGMKAAREYLDRQSGKSNPGGFWLAAHGYVCWYIEYCECCVSFDSLRTTHPSELLRHQRTMAHVANLYNLPVKDVDRFVRMVRFQRRWRVAAKGKRKQKVKIKCQE